MRQEEKEVDGPELEHAEERKRESELIEEDDSEVHDLDGKPYEMEGERDKQRSGLVVGAMRKILEGEQIVINDLKLSPRELKALDALQTAKRGRDGQLDRFIYAEDRRALLEQALAVLQPDIVNVEATIGGPLDELIKEVSELRVRLNTLEDAEEEVIHKPAEMVKTEGDSEDKPKPDDDQSLTGPERKIGKPESSLAKGPEVKEDKKPESTLTKGPELKDEKKPPTSLGDPKEIEESAKKAAPFWRRLFGG
ncbi:MAG TPA: hypothetical protein VLB44_13680 [Kofleriaceae bacterium]|nr:hypothetical protein [Kofleriaceae bacterium]